MIGEKLLHAVQRLFEGFRHGKMKIAKAVLKVFGH